eukprot:2235925-Pyramimonas_sp.AAC.2
MDSAQETVSHDPSTTPRVSTLTMALFFVCGCRHPEQWARQKQEHAAVSNAARRLATIQKLMSAASTLAVNQPIRPQRRSSTRTMQPATQASPTATPVAP